jgi:hypothetical protein
VQHDALQARPSLRPLHRHRPYNLFSPAHGISTTPRKEGVKFLSLRREKAWA